FGRRQAGACVEFHGTWLIRAKRRRHAGRCEKRRRRQRSEERCEERAVSIAKSAADLERRIDGVDEIRRSVVCRLKSSEEGSADGDGCRADDFSRRVRWRTPRRARTATRRELDKKGTRAPI